MQTYETSATVEGEGHLRVEGVPFPAGTRVEVTISPGQSSPVDFAATKLLFAALDKGRNVNPVGALRRDELYERDNIR